MTREVDDFLADADDVIDDWEGSADAAAWSADGSHEHDTDGDYYANRSWSRLHGGYLSEATRDEAQLFIAPVGTPLPSPAMLVPEFVEVKIEVTSPSGAAREFRIPRAQFTHEITQDPPDRLDWSTLTIPRLRESRVQFIIEPLDGRYEIRDPRVASTDG